MKRTIHNHPYADNLAKCETCGAWASEPCFDMRSPLWKVGPVLYKRTPHRGRR